MWDNDHILNIFTHHASRYQQETEVTEPTDQHIDLMHAHPEPVGMADQIPGGLDRTLPDAVAENQWAAYGLPANFDPSLCVNVGVYRMHTEGGDGTIPSDWNLLVFQTPTGTHGARIDDDACKAIGQAMFKQASGGLEIAKDLP